MMLQYSNLCGTTGSCMSNMSAGIVREMKYRRMGWICSSHRGNKICTQQYGGGISWKGAIWKIEKVGW